MNDILLPFPTFRGRIVRSKNYGYYEAHWTAKKDVTMVTFPEAIMVRILRFSEDLPPKKAWRKLQIHKRSGGYIKISDKFYFREETYKFLPNGRWLLVSAWVDKATHMTIKKISADKVHYKLSTFYC